MSYGRILVPLDGSVMAETALRYAELVPSQTVRLLSVEPVELSAARQRRARGEESPWGIWPTDSVAAYLTLVGTPFRTDARGPEVVVTAGDPWRRIVEAAARGCDHNGNPRPWGGAVLARKRQRARGAACPRPNPAGP